ncbi:Helix-turn-helix domain-containing protein [Nostoc sp. DSM 114161]|jgi:hypothetical protein|uniref:hypothetical protein n=1 Tax=Nostoc sp. DSM 114161 TaxID=3440143 RepID=UPI004045235B
MEQSPPFGFSSSDSTETAKIPTASPYQIQKAQKLVDDEQLRAITKDAVKEVLVEMLGLNTIQTQRQWYDTEQAYSRLDLDSAEQLRIMVRDGTLRLEHEVRDVRSPNSQVPRYQFHIEKCSTRLLQRPEKRRSVPLGTRKSNKKIA